MELSFIPQSWQDLGHQIGQFWPVVVALITAGAATRWIWVRVIQELKEELLPMQKELSANGGESVKDSIMRSEKKVDQALVNQTEMLRKIIAVDENRKAGITQMFQFTAKMDAKITEAASAIDAIVANSDLAYFETDPHQSVIKVNDAFLHLFGVSEEEAKSGHVRTLIHPDDRANVIEQSQGAINGLMPYYVQYRVKPHGYDDYILVETRSFPRKDLMDKFLGYTGSVRRVNPSQIKQ